MGDKKVFEFQNVTWKNDKITGFDAKFTDDNGIDTKMSVTPLFQTDSKQDPIKSLSSDDEKIIGFDIKFNVVKMQ